MESGSTVVLDQRIPTDIEEFWEHYHKDTLPKVFRIVMCGPSRRAASRIRASVRHAQDRHPSERAELRAGHRQGANLLPRSASGRHVLLHREFREHLGRSRSRPCDHLRRAGLFPSSMHPMKARTAMCTSSSTPNPPEIQWWSLPGPTRRVSGVSTNATSGYSPAPCSPRLVEARFRQSGPEALGWMLSADFKDDRHDDWMKLEGKDQVERGIFSAEQARGQLQWIERCTPPAYTKTSSHGHT